MSIFSSIVSFAAPIVGGLIGGPAGAAIGTAVGAAIAPKPVAQQAPRAAPRPTVQPGTGRSTSLLPVSMAPLPALSRIPNLGAGGVRPPTLELPMAGGACPVGFHLDKRSRTRCVRNRRMNPLNGKAATRAIRRIKGARKMLQKIERQLPRAKARATPRHGHRTTVTAT